MKMDDRDESNLASVNRVVVLPPDLPEKVCAVPGRMPAERMIINYRHIPRVLLKRLFGIGDDFFESPALKWIKKVENGRLGRKFVVGYIHAQVHNIPALH